MGESKLGIPPKGGLLILDKPEGKTSRQIDNDLQHLFHTKKVGHLGTLDPFATGLLLVAIGPATKYLPFLPDEEKGYLATLVLGEATSTGDYTGEKTSSMPVPPLTEDFVRETLKKMEGPSKQIPPMTSAIKIQGKALYEYAHKGVEIERKPRDIVVHSLELVSLKGNELVFRCLVSKGTYVRVLGEDMAKALGTCGHLKALRRESIGLISLQKAIALENVSEDSLVSPLDYIPYPHYALKGEEIKKARNGVALPLNLTSPRVLLFDGEQAVAIYERQGDVYRCLRGL